MLFKLLKYLFILAIIFYYFLILSIVLASDVNDVSSGSNILNVEFETPGEFIYKIYIFSLSIGGALAFGAIVYGGVLRIAGAGNPSKISEANEWIKSALIGLILLFGVYFVLTLINPNLVNLNLPQLKQPEVERGVQAVGVGGISDGEARRVLGAAGIGVKTSNTTLEGIRQETIDEIIRMKRECDSWMEKYYKNEGKCNVFITGGTENGPHKSGACSHGNGYKLDIRLSTRLNEFIEKTYCQKTSKGCTYYDRRIGDGALIYKSPTGATYAKEGNHWDMQATFACPRS